MVGIGGDGVVAVDVPLLGEDPRALGLELGRRDVDRLVGGLDRVADPGQEVGDGVGACAHGLLWFWDVLLVTTKTWSCQGQSRCGPSRAGRYGTGRTCGRRRGPGR